MVKKTNNKAESKKEKSSKSNGGLFVPAGIFLGMGTGFIVGNVPAGLFVGLGVGFSIMALISLPKKK